MHRQRRDAVCPKPGLLTHSAMHAFYVLAPILRLYSGTVQPQTSNVSTGNLEGSVGRASDMTIGGAPTHHDSQIVALSLVSKLDTRSKHCDNGTTSCKQDDQWMVSSNRCRVLRSLSGSRTAGRTSSPSARCAGGRCRSHSSCHGPEVNAAGAIYTLLASRAAAKPSS